MKRQIFLTFIAVIIVCGFAVIVTYALFSSQAKSEGNTFIAGTLKLGGIFGQVSTAEKFAHLNLSGIKPGQTTLLGPAKLKNVGSLPFKLYRITSSNVLDDSKLGEMLKVKVKIDDDTVYEGNISQLVESNGGYFDVINNVQPDRVRELSLEVSMDQNVGNEYQNKTIICDLNVYATQNEVPLNGEIEGTTVRFGPALDESGSFARNTFSVDVKNTQDNVVFAWNWEPADDKNWGSFEYYILEIKHETGNPTTNVESGRMKMKIDPIDEKTHIIESTDGISENEILIDWTNDEVKIKKDAFPKDWKGFEVKISGVQEFGGSIMSIPYQYWSLNR